MDIREIQNLIKFVAKSGATEVKLEMDDFKITIKTTEGGAAETTYIQQMPMQAMPQVAAPVAPAAAAPVAPVCSTSSRRKFKIHYYQVPNDWYVLQKTISRQTNVCGSGKYYC